MMEKNAFCMGQFIIVVGQIIWEVTLKRENLNLGDLSTQSV